MAICTIMTVTSWLISIGRIITIMQDPLIKLETKTYFFKRKIKNLKVIGIDKKVNRSFKNKNFYPNKINILNKKIMKNFLSNSK